MGAAVLVDCAALAASAAQVGKNFMAKRNPPDATRSEVKRADDKLAALIHALEARVTKLEARVAGLEAKVG